MKASIGRIRKNAMVHLLTSGTTKPCLIDSVSGVEGTGWRWESGAITLMVKKR